MFQDRLVSAEDRQWFNMLLKDRIQEFNCSFEEVVPCHPVLFGDFMTPGSDNTKVYTYIEDKEKVSGANQSLSLCRVRHVILPFIILSLLLSNQHKWSTFFVCVN